MMDTLMHFAVQIALVKPEYDVKEKSTEMYPRFQFLIYPTPVLQSQDDVATLTH